jgi:hypothetical protein
MAGTGTAAYHREHRAFGVGERTVWQTKTSVRGRFLFLVNSGGERAFRPADLGPDDTLQREKKKRKNCPQLQRRLCHSALAPTPQAPCALW